MLRFKNHNTGLSLITLSLLFLGIFLGYWIKDNYEKERENLRKDLGYMFSQATRTLEDSLIHKFLLGSMTIEIDEDSAPLNNFKSRKVIQLDKRISSDVPADSISMVYSSTVSGEMQAIHDSSIHMMIQTLTDSAHHSHQGKLLPVLMSWESDSLTLSLEDSVETENIVKLITSRFDDIIYDTSYPKSYKVSHTASDNIENGVVIDFFHLLHSNKVYRAEFSGYRTYLLDKIKVNILFSLFLFGAIAISFSMIYTNWREQRKLIEIKNDFISNVTHELKTPISTVSVALEALSDFDVLEDKAKTREYLRLSQKELSRLRILVDKVLKMSIFEKGASKLHLETVSMRTLVNDVLESMKIKFEKENAKVHCDFKGSEFQISLDKIHMTNVIYNLVDNAIKYCTQRPDIQICVEDMDTEIKITVEDNGIGIEEDDKAKIFNRFYRVPTGNLHRVKGHGLGLSYVASVIDKHGGQIQVESTPGKGSIFRIKLMKNV